MKRSAKIGSNDVLVAYSLTLLLLVAVGYSWAPQCKFTNYDDPPYVSENTHIAKGLSWPMVQWAFTTFEGANWHPVTWISHALDCQLFGTNPAGNHVMNVVLHAANSLLLFGLLIRLTARRLASFYVAALFAIHPLHVESVAWASERKDVLSTLFFLLTLHAYCRYAVRGGVWRYLLVVLWMALGLMSKPMLVTLPPLLLLLDIWPLCRWQPTSAVQSGHLRFRLLLEKLPLLLLSIAQSIVTLYAQRALGATHMLGDELSLAARLSNAGVATVSYLGMMFWPAGLAAFYPYAIDRSWIVVALAWLSVAAISAIVLAMYHRRPYLAFGWFWYLGTLVPVIGLIQVGAQSMADRYTYIPLIGIFWAIVWSVDDLASRPHRSRVAITIAWAAILCSLTVATNRQVVYWTNSETLFRHAIEVTANNCVAHDNLGDTLAKQHRYHEAEIEFRRVLAIDDRHFTSVRGELTDALKSQDKIPEAIELMREIVHRDPKDAQTRNNLAMLIGPRGCCAEAIQLLREATTLEPSRPEGWQNLAYALTKCQDARTHNGPEAVRAALKAVELTKERSAAALSVLADVYLETGDRVQAADALEKALKISPRDTSLHLRAAKVYRELGRVDEAIKHLSASDEQPK